MLLLLLPLRQTCLLAAASPFLPSSSLTRSPLRRPGSADTVARLQRYMPHEACRTRSVFTNQEHVLRSYWALDWIAWYAGHLVNPGQRPLNLLLFPEYWSAAAAAAWNQDRCRGRKTEQIRKKNPRGMGTKFPGEIRHPGAGAGAVVVVVVVVVVVLFSSCPC